MEFISIGPFCTTTQIIMDNNLRKHSYPFDYIFSSLEMVKHCIKDRFNIFLDKKYYKSSDFIEEPRMYHLFYQKFIDTEILKKHHMVHNLDDIANNLENREIFLHHNLLDDNTYSSFVRRCNRLLELIDNNSKIVFVYYNCYINKIDDIIDFQKHFSDNKNIYIVGILHNIYETKILYENVNCKIYQNYDNSFIFNEIQSFFK